MVIFAPAKIIRHALHVCHFFIEIVRVLVALAVADLLHQFCDGVADMQRNRLGGGLFHVFLSRAVSGVKRVRFRRQRQINDGLRQSQTALRHSKEINGVFCREA